MAGFGGLKPVLRPPSGVIAGLQLHDEDEAVLLRWAEARPTPAKRCKHWPARSLFRAGVVIVV